MPSKHCYIDSHDENHFVCTDPIGAKAKAQYCQSKWLAVSEAVCGEVLGAVPMMDSGWRAGSFDSQSRGSVGPGGQVSRGRYSRCTCSGDHSTGTYPPPCNIWHCYDSCSPNIDVH